MDDLKYPLKRNLLKTQHKHMPMGFKHVCVNVYFCLYEDAGVCVCVCV